MKQALKNALLYAMFTPAGVVLGAEVVGNDSPKDESPQLSEIIVTATRHEESLSKVPISVSAYTQDAMDTKGVRDFTDIARYTPGVQIASTGSNTISIRGIGSSGGAATTGIYIDDTPVQIRASTGNSDSVLPKTFDMDRVEVLRGPQGTLFGAGSEGGTVRYIMTQPSVSRESGYARTELSYTQDGAPNYEAGAAYGAPIVDGTLGFRLSAWYRRDGGWVDRVDFANPNDIIDPNTNRSSAMVLRGALLWNPTENVSITPSIIFQNRQRHDVSDAWGIYSDANVGRFVSADPQALIDPDKYIMPALKVSADLAGIEFISNSSYFQRRNVSPYDGTMYNLGYYQTLGEFSAFPLIDGNGIHLPPGLANYRSPATITNKQDNVTQEFRLQSSDQNARIVWTVGAFYSLDRTFSLEEIHDPQADEFFEQIYGTTMAAFLSQPDEYDEPIPTNPNGSTYLPRGDSYLNQLTYWDRQLAGFGEVVWGLTNSLKLTTGVRYSKTDATFSSYSDGPQNGGALINNVPVGGTIEPDATQHENPITERASLSWQVNPNNLLYATYSTGFRIGGPNAVIPPSLCPAELGPHGSYGIADNPASYKSDTVENYEIGDKTNINNRIRIASSLYYIKWNDIQQTVLLPDCGIAYIDNVGTAVSKGGDLQADFAVTEHFTLESAVGYNDAYYTSNVSPSGNPSSLLVHTGDAIVGFGGPPAPWTITLGAEYHFKFLERDSYIRLDVEDETKTNRPTAAEDPRTAQYRACPTYTGVSISCSTTPPATAFTSLRAGQDFGGWNVSAFVDNLFNVQSLTSTSYSQLANATTPPLFRYTTVRPRTAGITAVYRF